MGRPREQATAVDRSRAGGEAPAGVSRRGFVAAGAAVGTALSIARGANAAGSDRLKVEIGRAHV